MTAKISNPPMPPPALPPGIGIGIPPPPPLSTDPKPPPPPWPRRSSIRSKPVFRFHFMIVSPLSLPLGGGSLRRGRRGLASHGRVATLHAYRG